MEELIHRLLDGTPLSDSESRELLDWLRANEENRRTFVQMYRAWGEAHTDPSRFDGEQAWRFVAERIAAQTQTPARGVGRMSRLRLGVRLATAAAAALCGVLAATWIDGRDVATPPAGSFALQTSAADFSRGEVSLRLPSGQELLLTEKNPSIRYNGPRVEIGELYGNLLAIGGDTPCNELLVPYGRQSHLTLSDGTRIWVNAGSKLVYPTLFGPKTREIRVEGEVYMEVAHDASRPFIVHSGTMNVRVLGTKFYLSSYGEHQTREVVLLSGSVSVGSTLGSEANNERRIVPNQQAILHEDGTIDVRKVAARDRIAWIDGYLQCDNERLGDLLDRLARYYNCRLEHAAEIDDLPISGKLELQPEITDVLRILSLTTPIRVEPRGEGFRIITCNR